MAKAAKGASSPKKATKKTGKRTVNKSEEIRVFAKANPGLGPTAITKALAAKGIEVSPPQVSNVLSAAGKGKKAKKKPGPKPGRKSAGRPAAASSTVSIESLVDAKKFAEKVGGVDEAKQLITALEKVTD